jgi:hypothetical protein
MTLKRNLKTSVRSQLKMISKGESAIRLGVQISNGTQEILNLTLLSFLNLSKTHLGSRGDNPTAIVGPVQSGPKMTLLTKRRKLTDLGQDSIGLKLS